MANDDEPMVELTEDECWRRLATVEGARVAIAVTVAGEAEVFPVNIVVDGRTVVFRTAEGTKLLAAVIAGRSTVEADGFDPGPREAWSVVMKGTAEVVDDERDYAAVEALPLKPWHPGPKGRWVRVRPTMITGRSFRRSGAPQ